MSSRTSCVDRVWQGGAPASGVALIVVLITVSVIVTGAGLNSSAVWLILASICILLLALCSCMKCRKRVSRWRRSSNDSDTISTISDGNDNYTNMMYPSTLQEVPAMRRDLPPSYATVIAPDQPPPPYSALVHCLRTTRTSIIATIDDNETPPPYSQCASPDIVSEVNSINEELSRQRPSLASDTDGISIISTSDMNSDNKYLGDVSVNCEMRTLDNTDRVSDVQDRERTSSC